MSDGMVSLQSSSRLLRPSNAPPIVNITSTRESQLIQDPTKEYAAYVKELKQDFISQWNAAAVVSGLFAGIQAQLLTQPLLPPRHTKSDTAIRIFAYGGLLLNVAAALCSVMVVKGLCLLEQPLKRGVIPDQAKYESNPDALVFFFLKEIGWEYVIATIFGEFCWDYGVASLFVQIAITLWAGEDRLVAGLLMPIMVVPAFVLIARKFWAQAALWLWRWLLNSDIRNSWMMPTKTTIVDPETGMPTTPTRSLRSLRSLRSNSNSHTNTNV
jgi:hypothetical protein